MSEDLVIRSAVYRLPSPDIDTDRIFPSRFQNRVDGKTDLAGYFFHDQRFDGQGKAIAGEPLNDPSVSGAAIILAGPNYACGSARPGAIFSHIDFGIRILLAESFGPVFAAVCFKFGLIPIELPAGDIARLNDMLDSAPGAVLSVDLQNQEIHGPQGDPIRFALDEYVRMIALSGRSEISVTQSFAEEFTAFEARRRQEAPWLFEDATEQEAGLG